MRVSNLVFAFPLPLSNKGYHGFDLGAGRREAVDQWPEYCAARVCDIFP